MHRKHLTLLPKKTVFEVNILVDTDLVGYILGKGGATIKKFERKVVLKLKYIKTVYHIQQNVWLQSEVTMKNKLQKA